MRLEGDSTYEVLRNHDPKMDFMSRYHENKMDTLTRYPESKIDLLNRYSHEKSVDVFPLSPTSPYEVDIIVLKFNLMFKFNSYFDLSNTSNRQ